MIVLNFCVTCFLAGIVISGVSGSFTTLIFGRVIQGIGGGGIILMNDILITDLVPLRLRGAYFGIIAGIWALGSISGPLIGGALAFKVSWVCHIRASRTVLAEMLMNLEVDILDEYSICHYFTGHGPPYDTA
jgi:MFS family permease